MNAAVGADERLVVMLEARVSEFEKRMRQAENRGTRTYQGLSRNSRSATRQMEQDMIRSTSRINQALASTSSQIGTFSKAFAGGLIGGAATAAFAGLTSNIGATVKSMAELGNEAKRAGLSTDAFQEWKFLADQNRISVDALVDGFKELALRADEFIVTGVGPAAEAFNRLGLRADDLKRKLKDPSALMLEILGRLEGFDKAAQIRIADEIFGGTGGERFVELLGQGQGALQDTINKAHETGAVLDAELIAKADEIDRKFSQLTTTAANFGKAMVVNLVAAGAELADLRARLDTIFANEAEGRAILGDEVYDALAQNRDLVEQNEEALARLDERYATLAEEADRAGVAMIDAISRLDSLGYDTAADALRVAYEEMQNLVQAFRDGEISGEDFTVKLGEIEAAAVDAFGALEAGDRTTFEGVISQLGRLGGVIASVTSLANSMGAAIARAAGTAPDQKATQAMRDRHAAEQASMDSMEAQREALEGFTAAEEARNSASAEQLALQREIEAVRRRAGEAGASLTDQQANDLAAASLAGAAGRSAAGKGGGSKGRKSSGAGKAAVDEFAKEAQAIRERTAALEAEAAVLVAVAASGKEYGDAMEFARTKAELLHAAQQAGKQITPELEAEIDKLADAYVQAGLEAEGAAEKLDAIKERSQAGKDALSDMFGSIIDGSKSAKQAVADLLLEIAKTQMIKGIMGLPGMGGIASSIGGLLVPGFASGGDHMGGLRIVGEKGPELEATGPARIWSADQTRNLLAGRQGSSAIADKAQSVDVHVTVGVDPKSGNLTAFVDQRSIQVARRVQKDTLRQAEDNAYLWNNRHQMRRG
ncbi:hypothetical protein PARHAE_02499 [Paracoccus haematequi]|uniref:Uncharacterized protein n=1 Tax=Paracoccus haematequi TaxID=2491866 RepID=A0A447IP54_9RHOB|nr:hypothetical protein [Paracoccus haematequi]VDS09301.1 hypothetical protein PARHAE_02499 [Paracoccus haematequi]